MTQVPPPPPPQPATGWLRLTLQGSPLSTNLITPAVSVNGYRVPAQYGDNVIPVYAGPTRVDVSCQWLRQFGQAALETQVPPGGQVQVFYAALWHQFTRGAIGYTRQTRPGAAGLVVIVTIIVLFVLAFVVLAATVGS